MPPMLCSCAINVTRRCASAARVLADGTKVRICRRCKAKLQIDGAAHGTIENKYLADVVPAHDAGVQLIRTPCKSHG